MSSASKELLTMTSVHFVAPDGYLRVVKPTILHATAVSWMRVEYTSWIGSRLLTPAAFILISDCNIRTSLCYMELPSLYS